MGGFYIKSKVILKVFQSLHFPCACNFIASNFYMRIIIMLICLSVFNCTGVSQQKVIDADSIFSQLKTEQRNDRILQLILKLSAFKQSDFPPAKLDSFIHILLELYKTNPHPGVHSAIDYLFRETSNENTGNPGWKKQSDLGKIDKIFAGRISNDKQWFVTSEGQTMTMIAGPVSFTMGSPESEKYRDSDEVQHKVLIPRSFAISTKEITVVQFQKFLDDNPAIKEHAKADPAKYPGRSNEKLLVFSPDEQCPQILVTWYEAAQYCNWLSKQEDIPEKEWCYPPLDQIRNGMRLPNDHLTRTGYRLPTEAEWEYACRAGTGSNRFFGDSDQQLQDYAWYSKNPPLKKADPIDPDDPRHTYPVGQLKPNSLGLFDMYGNVWEWCHSRRLPYTSGTVKDVEDKNIIITDSVAMIRRGGSFSYSKDVMRSAHRGATNYFPMQRRDNVGFRISRTLR